MQRSKSILWHLCWCVVCLWLLKLQLV